MCKLYGHTASKDQVAAYYRAEVRDPDAQIGRDYVAPGKHGYIVREDAGARVVDMMTWGWPNPRGGEAVVNVRNYASPFWRSALANPARRCLVPFTRFQEWSAEPDPATGKKRPYWFSLPSRPIGTFGGVWRPSEAGPVFAFLTTGYGDEPGAAEAHAVGAIHPKAIPVILHDEDFERWLSAPIEQALELAVAFPSQLIEVSG